jgi:hypothetical protein
MMQASLFDSERETSGLEPSSGPVECLGMTFPSDEERWKYFLEMLREKLKDSEFRMLDGRGAQVTGPFTI